MKNVILGSTLAIMLGIAPFAFATENGEIRREDRREDRKEDRKNSSSITLDATQMACIKTAVGKREDSLVAGHDAYALAIKNAYTARKTALMSTWDLTDKTARRSAVKSADQAFRTSAKSARSTWNTARKASWKTFETDRKACLPTNSSSSVSSSDTGSSSVDATL